MPPFDYRTAYAEDWRFFPNVVDAKIELRSAAGVVDPPALNVHAVQDDVGGSDWSEFAGGAILADVDLYFWYVWPPIGDGSDPVPQLDDVLVANGRRYTIKGVGKGQCSARWRIATAEVLYE